MNHSGEAYPVGMPVEGITGIWEPAPPSSGLRSLAIVGSHPATRELAPYDDPDYDIWLFNEAAQKLEVYRRWTNLFQMHTPEVYASDHNWVNMDHWRWLQQDHGDKVIWMQEIDPRVPNSRRYPLEEILTMVGMPYLRSTPAMALALAIWMGYKHIELYGSELTSNTEYTYQAINYAFWIGFAKGCGVDLELMCWKNEFYDQPIYGYEGETQIPPEYFAKRIERLEIEYKGKQSALEKFGGRLKDAFASGDFEKSAELIVVLEEIALSVGQLEGALGEARRYHERTNPISRQEFERVAAKAQRDGPGLEQQRHKSAGVTEYVWNAWRISGRLDALQNLRHFFDRKITETLASGRMAGVFMENTEYLREYDRLVTAAGGQRAVYQVHGDGK